MKYFSGMPILATKQQAILTFSLFAVFGTLALTAFRYWPYNNSKSDSRPQNQNPRFPPPPPPPKPTKITTEGFICLDLVEGLGSSLARCPDMPFWNLRSDSNSAVKFHHCCKMENKAFDYKCWMIPSEAPTRFEAHLETWYGFNNGGFSLTASLLKTFIADEIPKICPAICQGYSESTLHCAVKSGEYLENCFKGGEHCFPTMVKEVAKLT